MVRSIRSDTPARRRPLDADIDAALDELKGSILPESTSVECLAADVTIRAAQYLNSKQEEQNLRHTSKIRRDLDRFAKSLDKFIAWCRSPNKRKASGLSHIQKAIAALNVICTDHSFPILLRQESRKDIDAVINRLESMNRKTKIDSHLEFDVAEIEDLRDFICATENYLNESRLGKSSRRRSNAAEIFLDALATDFAEHSGGKVSYTWNAISGEADSPFCIFVKRIFVVVDPEVSLRGLETKIQAAVRRHKKQRDRDQD